MRKEGQKARRDIQKICPGDDALRLERYYKAAKTIGKGDKVENLMQGILKDLQLLACEHGIKTANESRMEQVAVAITEMAALPTSATEQSLQEAGITTFQSGSGTQYNAQGKYIVQGEARQFNSGGGTMNFGND